MSHLSIVEIFGCKDKVLAIHRLQFPHPINDMTQSDHRLKVKDCKHRHDDKSNWTASILSYAKDVALLYHHLSMHGYALFYTMLMCNDILSKVLRFVNALSNIVIL